MDGGVHKSKYCLYIVHRDHDRVHDEDTLGSHSLEYTAAL